MQLCKQDAGQGTPPPSIPSHLPGYRQDCDHHISAGGGGSKLEEPVVCRSQRGVPEHHATALSTAGFNEVKYTQDSSMGTARVISYLWRYELCLCYCLHTFPPLSCTSHCKKKNYTYTCKSM